MITASQLVVVTGGAGFIGSHTVDRLLQSGHRVIVIDDFSTGKRANLARWANDERLRVVEANIADGLFAPLTAALVAGERVDRIIHLAAQISVVASLQSPLHDARVNYGATMHVMEFARVHRVQKVVFASSAAVYGDEVELPVREEQRTRPLSPYGLHKLASEKCIEYYSTVHGTRGSSLRFFNVFGPRQDPKSPYSGVISIFFSRALNNEPLTVFGTGEQTRDFVFVGDVSDALCRACFSSHLVGDVANIGTGRETSVRDLAAAVVEVADSRSDIRHAPARTGEILNSCASVEKAERLLSFRAQVALRDGLSETLAWQRSG